MLKVVQEDRIYMNKLSPPLSFSTTMGSWCTI